MLATKIPPAARAAFLASVAAAILAGCTPPGPRALLDGEQSLKAGKTDRAIVQLKEATELLPADPRAWNLLGVAHHRAGERALALQAYRQAIQRDRSNLVVVAHYNLGCLFLEQNSLAAAIDSLRSYTLLTNNPTGLAKLGTAQLRARQFSDAERSFAAALRVDAKHAEALNGMGVLRAQRGMRDAQNYFAAATQARPDYSPALLNSAVLAHQTPATRPLALQKYREYLAARSTGAQAPAVKLLVRQLESELAPPAPSTVVKSNPASANTSVNDRALAIAKSNLLAAALRTNSAVSVSKTNVSPPPLVRSNPPVAVAPTITNKPVKVAPAPKPVPAVTIVPVTNSAPVAPPAKEEIKAPAAPPIVVQEKPKASEPARTINTPAISPALVPSAPEAASEPEKKRGFFSRMNPFGKKDKETNTAPATRTVVINPSVPGIEPTSRVVERPNFPRYRYVSPARPAAGNRAEAERALQQALAAQRAGRAGEAESAYSTALNADPSYFEAQYNSAVFALQSGKISTALSGWETTLAIQPDSINARYSFGLALKQAGYATDAAIELEKVVEAKPDDARAHLALGNLYAQQLGETEKARAHYLKVLSLEPRHSQAPAIRFWLAANP